LPRRENRSSIKKGIPHGRNQIHGLPPSGWFGGDEKSCDCYADCGVCEPSLTGDCAKYLWYRVGGTSTRVFAAGQGCRLDGAGFSWSWYSSKCIRNRGCRSWLRKYAGPGYSSGNQTPLPLQRGILRDYPRIGWFLRRHCRGIASSQ
jgi:hypothetical protein